MYKKGATFTLYLAISGANSVLEGGATFTLYLAISGTNSVKGGKWVPLIYIYPFQGLIVNGKLGGGALLHV